MEFVPNHAPLVVLAFLLTGFVGFVGTVLLVGALFARRWEWARKIVVALVALTCLYGITLLAASLASSEKTLRAGEKKYFCEIDCHLAYSVTSVQTAKTLGSGERQATAAGMFYVVTLQTYFDEKTTSATRGNGLLYPNLRMVRMVDEQGQWIPASLEGTKALGAQAAKMVPLEQPLRPGDSYETTLVFDLPPGTQNPRLWLTDPELVNRVLIGHESSYFHKKVYFGLETGKVVAGSR
ncbi:MAG: hypothetical protein HYR58_01985 [Acidobacteria bacterium]|nr:hypothetical protein [Acidobacteriota bacterium]MBI3485081.1 hypothetical protein [Acidobacteriota bacterium]